MLYCPVRNVIWLVSYCVPNGSTYLAWQTTYFVLSDSANSILRGHGHSSDNY